MKIGICIKVSTTKPKKPNSAIRKIAKVQLLSNMRRVRAVIPGSGFEIAEHNTVAVRAGRARDIPGIHYKLVRGVADLGAPTGFDRQKRRSKFGQQSVIYFTKHPDTGAITGVTALRGTRNRFERDNNLPLTYGRRLPIALPSNYRIKRKLPDGTYVDD